MIGGPNIYVKLFAETGGLKIDPIETLVIALIVVFAALLVWKSIESQKTRKSTGRESLIGKEGIVVNQLNPDGWISIEGVRWRAHSTGSEPVIEGERVKVLRLEGLSIVVEKLNSRNPDS